MTVSGDIIHHWSMEERNEMFYLMMLSTHFIYGYKRRQIYSKELLR